MNIEKTYFKVYWLEVLKYAAFVLILANGTVFLFTLLRGNPRWLLYPSSWIMQLVYPLMFAIIQTLVNRNGLLKLTNRNDFTVILKFIETNLFTKGYIVAESITEETTYILISKLNRWFNRFFNSDVIVKTSGDEVLIYGRKNILNSLEMKLKYDRSQA